MIGHVLAITLPGFAVGAVMMALGNRGLEPAAARARWLKFAVFFLIVHAFLAAAAGGRHWILLLVAIILAAGAIELANATRRMRRGNPAIVWLAYAAIGALLLSNAARLRPEAVAYLYLVVAACDGFSQVSGQILGRRRLAPTISPGKTVEGLAGGLAAAVVVAVALRALVGLDVAGAAVAGVATGLVGLGGDLAASWVKRSSGLKDFSEALPGQGGFLDRFDSFLLAGAIVGLALLAAHGGM
jgi:phosphatidate cytidylyltransferase